MKKVVGILLIMVMVVMLTTVAFGDMTGEITDFCKDNRSLKRFVEQEEGKRYNKVGDCAYTIASFEEICSETDIHEFIKWYESYLKDNFPEMQKNVTVEYTYAGSTENYRLYCIWLELNNGKTFKDYLDPEPDLSKMAGIIGLKK